MKLKLNLILWFVLSLFVVVITFQVSAGAASTPVVFNSSLSGKPGDVIGIQGSRFGSKPQVFLSRPSNQAIQLSIVNQGNDFIAAQIPESEPFGLYEIKVSNETNSSKVVYLNQARGMSFDTPEIAPGGNFRIFGRNLFVSGATPSVRFVNTSTKASSNATAIKDGSDAYVLNVAAPSDITPGTRYEVYVSNGHGGAAGETKVENTILGRKGGTDKWDLRVGWAADYDFYNNVYNVKTDSRLNIHAVGNGDNDDQAAIQNAINVASQAGGGVVYLPAGTYKLAMQTNAIGIRLAPRVVLQGAGRDTTIINYGYGQQPVNGGYVLEWPDKTSVAGIADFTLHNVNEQGQWQNTMQAWGKVSEIFMQRIELDMSSADGIYVGNMEKLAIENSIFNQSPNKQNHGPWILDGNQYFVLRGNSVTHATGGYSLNQVSNGVIENNHFTRDGSFKPNFEVRNLNLNFTTNIAIINNIFDVINGPVSFWNDGETILTEGGGAGRTDEGVGTISVAGTRTLQDSSKNWNSSSFNNKAIVAIVSGRGTGQWRAITGVADNNTLKIDRAWDVIPEQGAHYATFDWSAANWIVKGNKLSDNSRGIWLYSASARDVAIFDNYLTNNGSILLRTDQKSDAMHTVIFNVQIINNRVSDTNGLRGAFIGNLSAHQSKETTFGVGLLGLEVRGNAISSPADKFQSNSHVEETLLEGYGNSVHYEYGSIAPFQETGQPAILGTIFQGNKAENCDHAYQLSTGVYRTTIWKATTNNTKRIIEEETFPGASQASKGTLTKS